MRMRLACAVALLTVAQAAWACGYCVEDKVAATYDHAVVSRARERGDVVVFAQVSGAMDAASLTLKARQATARLKDVDPGSIRVNETAATISFALRSRNQTPAEALAAAERAAAGRVKLTLLTVMR